jgi:hypothetical protein
MSGEGKPLFNGTATSLGKTGGAFPIELICHSRWYHFLIVGAHSLKLCARGNREVDTAQSFGGSNAQALHD